MAWIMLLVGILSCPITAVNITFTQQPDNLTVREGNTFQLSCNISVEEDADNITLQFYWEKDGDLFINGSELSVTSAKSSHSGVYVCVVRVDGGGTEEEKRSRNATVTVIISDLDSAPRIAMIVCVTTVALIFVFLCISIGLYMCCCRSDGKSCCSCWQRRGKKYHQRKSKLPSPAPRSFSSGVRSKSKSLSQLVPSAAEGFPLDTALHKSSTNLLCGSQPTQVTDIEDPSTLDFDLALDEAMFEHKLSLSSPHKLHTLSDSSDRAALLARESIFQGRKKKAIRQEHVGDHRATERRASEGQLVVPEAIATSKKSILKESKSFNDDLHNQNRSCAVSDVSSDITQSDDNSLHLGKSVRFNVSEDDWMADSGVHTGSSTPHNVRYSPFERRASEPEALGHHFNNSVRRGSAPGDLVSKSVCTMAGQESSEEVEERNEEIDEGLATCSEEWSQQEKYFSFEEAQAERQFKGAFLQSRDEQQKDKTDSSTQQDTKNKPRSSGIASRVAQLLSASQKQAEGSFVRGPSTLTVSYSAMVPQLKVSEMKERFLQGSGGKVEETSHTGREEGRRPSLSKLVQERAEVFKEKHSIDKDSVARVGSLKRTHRREEKSSDKDGTESKDGRKESAKQSADTKTALPETKLEPVQAIPQDTKDEPQFSDPPIEIPIFSGPSGLSNWVPACLRETVISPYSYRDSDDQLKEEQDSDSSEDDDDVLIEPLKPILGRDMLGTGSVMTMASFGGVATMSPIGRSWLSSGKPSGPVISPLVSKPTLPGTNEKSPFNESFSLQRSGHAARPGAINRLSVIPEETASACGSITDINNEKDQLTVITNGQND